MGWMADGFMVGKGVRPSATTVQVGLVCGFDGIQAYFLLTQAGRVRVGNMVDPDYTLGASSLKPHLGQ